MRSIPGTCPQARSLKPSPQTQEQQTLQKRQITVGKRNAQNPERINAQAARSPMQFVGGWSQHSEIVCHYGLNLRGMSLGTACLKAVSTSDARTGALSPNHDHIMPPPWKLAVENAVFKTKASKVG